MKLRSNLCHFRAESLWTNVWFTVSPIFLPDVHGNKNPHGASINVSLNVSDWQSPPDDHIGYSVGKMYTFAVYWNFEIWGLFVTTTESVLTGAMLTHKHTN